MLVINGLSDCLTTSAPACSAALTVVKEWNLDQYTVMGIIRDSLEDV